MSRVCLPNTNTVSSVCLIGFVEISVLFDIAPACLNRRSVFTLRSRMYTDDGDSKKRRGAQACNKCRTLRQKCNGLSPCEYCSRRGFACEFDAPRKRGRKFKVHHAGRSNAGGGGSSSNSGDGDGDDGAMLDVSAVVETLGELRHSVVTHVSSDNNAAGPVARASSPETPVVASAAAGVASSHASVAAPVVLRPLSSFRLTDVYVTHLQPFVPSQQELGYVEHFFAPQNERRHFIPRLLSKTAFYAALSSAARGEAPEPVWIACQSVSATSSPAAAAAASLPLAAQASASGGTGIGITEQADPWFTQVVAPDPIRGAAVLPVTGMARYLGFKALCNVVVAVGAFFVGHNDVALHYWTLSEAFCGPCMLRPSEYFVTTMALRQRSAPALAGVQYGSYLLATMAAITDHLAHSVPCPLGVRVLSANNHSLQQGVVPQPHPLPATAVAAMQLGQRIDRFSHLLGFMGWYLIGKYGRCDDEASRRRLSALLSELTSILGIAAPAVNQKLNIKMFAATVDLLSGLQSGELKRPSLGVLADWLQTQQQGSASSSSSSASNSNGKGSNHGTGGPGVALLLCARLVLSLRDLRATAAAELQAANFVPSSSSSAAASAAASGSSTPAPMPAAAANYVALVSAPELRKVATAAAVQLLRWSAHVTCTLRPDRDGVCRDRKCFIHSSNLSVGASTVSAAASSHVSLSDHNSVSGDSLSASPSASAPLLIIGAPSAASSGSVAARFSSSSSSSSSSASSSSDPYGAEPGTGANLLSLIDNTIREAVTYLHAASSSHVTSSSRASGGHVALSSSSSSAEAVARVPVATSMASRASASTRNSINGNSNCSTGSSSASRSINASPSVAHSSVGGGSGGGASSTFIASATLTLQPEVAASMGIRINASGRTRAGRSGAASSSATAAITSSSVGPTPSSAAAPAPSATVYTHPIVSHPAPAAAGPPPPFAPSLSSQPLAAASSSADPAAGTSAPHSSRLESPTAHAYSAGTAAAAAAAAAMTGSAAVPAAASTSMMATLTRGALIPGLMSAGPSSSNMLRENDDDDAIGLPMRDQSPALRQLADPWADVLPSFLGPSAFSELPHIQFSAYSSSSGSASIGGGPLHLMPSGRYGSSSSHSGGYAGGLVHSSSFLVSGVNGAGTGASPSSSGIGSLSLGAPSGWPQR